MKDKREPRSFEFKFDEKYGRIFFIDNETYLWKTNFCKSELDNYLAVDLIIGVSDMCVAPAVDVNSDYLDDSYGLYYSLSDAVPAEYEVYIFYFNETLNRLKKNGLKFKLTDEDYKKVWR